MKTGAPVHGELRGDADRLLFVLDAHKFVRIPPLHPSVAIEEQE